MKACLLAPGPAAPGPTAAVVRLGRMLARAGHEVTVLEPPARRSPEVEGFAFASEVHRESAALLEELRERYAGDGLDYLEVCDSSPLGLVPLQAREGGEPVLSRTLVGVRAWPSHSLCSIQNQVLSQEANRQLADLEREQLRLADLLLWPGGDVLDLYRRHYDAVGAELPEPLRAPPPEPAPRAPAPARRDPAGPLRLLYLGPLERRLGVFDLVEACLGLALDEWELSLAGPETETAVMGQSAELTIAAMSGGDPRVRILERVPAEPGEHDLVVVPARVEAWSEAAAIAAAAAVPVLATPVGGLVEQVEDGVNGWLAEDLGPLALARALEPLVAEPGRVRALAAAGGVERHRERLAAPGRALAAYERIADRVREPAAERARPRTEPLVTGIVPFYGAAEFVGAAVESLLAQTHPRLEVLIVNDGSFRPEDAVLDGLAEDPRVTVVTQANSGEAAARNLGAVLARGEYLIMLDADNLLAPRFAERALAAFARRPDLAYVTCWLRMIDEAGRPLEPTYGYAPLGNGVDVEDRRNWDGDTLAMLPRALFTEHGFGYGPGGSMHSDWELYRWLRSEGRLGLVLPECLAHYRVRRQSLLRGHGEELQDRGWAESRDRNRQRRMRWIAPR